ncbi:MAG TPA: host-nuclease inhibitor Gam family protein [Spirochaetota bacterium]|nr:host-nuclease inhibitor Gam family protein [Spirochaetota bacterium]HQO03407.1 host-nuclease inhibitor Gam family protein [Spirochaetota bacterium]
MTKTRKRITGTAQIKSLEDANAALAEIGRLTLQIEAIDGKATEKIGKIKEDAAIKGKEARERIQDIETALSLYADYNKAELFQDRKSIPLTYGQIGFRMSTKVSIKRTTLELLKKLFPGKGLRVKEEVDKEQLKDWPDEDLAQVDAAKVPQDTFFYEVNRDEVNKDLLKAG